MSHTGTSSGFIARFTTGLAGITGWRGLRPSLPRQQIALITALETLSDAVSSAKTATDILECVVKEAKQFTGAEKVAVVLVDDSGKTPIVDRSTLVVRGARAIHNEEWWGDRLSDIAQHVFSVRTPFFEASSEHRAWLFAVPVQTQGKALGILIAVNSLDHRLREDQTAYFAVLAAVSAVALSNVRLAEESRYGLLASERERISRDMHDGIAQSLFSISLGLEVCRRQVRRDPGKVAERLTELQDLLTMSQTELRRYIYDLRPVKLQELGLRGALEYWIKEIAPVGTKKTSVEEQGNPSRLNAQVESCLYSVAREAVTNAAKHADPVMIRVRIEYAPEMVILIVEDDGCGFNPEAIIGDPAKRMRVGLRSLRERVHAAGGELIIDSAPGSGCRVAVRVPL